MRYRDVLAYIKRVCISSKTSPSIGDEMDNMGTKWTKYIHVYIYARDTPVDMFAPIRTENGIDPYYEGVYKYLKEREEI